MPNFTIDLPERLLPGLRAVVERHNANQGVAMTVQEWVELHVREIAVSDALAAEQQNLARQAERDLEEALKAVRERLIEGMSSEEPEA